jgi:hypothetical protein
LLSREALQKYPLLRVSIKAELKLEIKQDPLLAKTTGLAEEDSDETRIASLPESTKDGFWWGWCSLSLE